MSRAASLPKFLAVLSLAIVFAAIAVPLRAEDKLDKKVVEICKKVGELYKNAKTIHAEGTLATKLDNNGEKQEINVTAIFDVERPNHFSVKTQLAGDSKKGPDVFSDGKKLTIYRKALQQYVQEDAPTNVNELGNRLAQLGPVMTGILFANVLNDDPADALMQGVNSCSYVGLDKVDGSSAHHMKFSQDQFDWEMWVAAEGKPFVLKMSRNVDADGVKMTGSETYKNSTVDAPAGKDSFTFSAPKGSAKVEEFKEN